MGSVARPSKGSPGAHLASQALIYWYYSTKEALFQAVLGHHLPIVQAVADPASLLERPPEDVLPLLARAYLEMPDRPAALRIVRLFAPRRCAVLRSPTRWVGVSLGACRPSSKGILPTRSSWDGFARTMCASVRVHSLV